jgi:hypothetical protein
MPRLWTILGTCKKPAGQINRILKSEVALLKRFPNIKVNYKGH